MIRKVDEARATVAAFVGASANEIVFTKNTTEAINTVSRGLVWNEGEGIVLTTLEHQSNIIPWLRVAQEAKLDVYYLTHGPDGLVSTRDLEKLLNEHRIRMVAVTHVSNVLGTIQGVSALVKMARQKGCLTLIDAAQSAGRIPVNVAGIGCDFATFCGRKALMGPQGTGFLYGRRELLQDLMPLTVGSRAADIQDGTHFRYQAPPHQFEAGVLNTSGFIGMARSLDYLTELGFELIMGRIRELSRMLVDELAGRKGVLFHSPRDLEAQAGIVSWTVPGATPTDVATFLDKEVNVAVATGHQGSRLVTDGLSSDGIIRTSVGWFTVREDIEALAAGLDRLLAGR